MKNRYQFLNFPKPRRSCSKCHKEFEQDAEIYSTIVDEREEKLLRVDCCPSCFESEKDNISDQAKWKLIKPEEKISKRLSWKELDERAFLLLDEALAQPSEEAKQEAALLALHLLRRRKLVVDSENEETVVYRNIETGVLMALPRVQAPSPELQSSLQKKLFSA